MGYAQNIQLELITKSKSRSYKVQSATLKWGKFYRNPDKNAEISANDVNQLSFKYNASGVVAACGRENASSGTEGSIDIWDLTSNVRVGTVYWDDPWASGTTNVVRADRVNEDYAVEVGPYPSTGAAIGWVKITVSHID